MYIVFEGNDGSGKSTLIERMKQSVGFHIYEVVVSEGPPKFAGEMAERVERYLQRASHRTIFDRHPCVSNELYDVLRRAEDKPIDVIPGHLRQRFYALKPLFVYCDPIDDRHAARDDECSEHIAMIARRRRQLTTLYREWAIENANIIYRIGDDMDKTIAAIAAMHLS